MEITRAKANLLDESKIFDVLKTTILESIQNKNPLFNRVSFGENYSLLDRNSLIITHSSGSFEIRYEKFEPCFVLLNISEEILKEKLPADIIGSLEFVDRFCAEIKKPKQNQKWYGHLESNFKRFILVYLNHEYSIDITSFLHTVDDDMKEKISALQSFDRYYRDACPFLSDPMDKIFESLIYLNEQSSKEYVPEILNAIGKYNFSKAQKLYEYIEKSQSQHSPIFLSFLLVGIFKNDETTYLEKAMELYSSYPIEGIRAFGWINYSTAEQIIAVHNILTKNVNESHEYKFYESIFYIRQIENKAITVELKAIFVEKIKSLYAVEDDKVKRNIEWRVGGIKEHDAEKFNLLLTFINSGGGINVAKGFFSNFKDPKYLFSLIENAYLTMGVRMQIEFFREALFSLSRNNPDATYTEIKNLLSHKLASGRLAAIQMLGLSFIKVHNISLLELDEMGQLNIIESIEIQPNVMDGLFSLLIQLRKSTHQSVREKLFEALVELIWAYDKYVLESLENEIDMADAEDSELYSRFKSVYDAFAIQKENRKKIKELNPIENELSFMEDYYKHENEYQRKLMEEAGKKTFFSMIGKEIKVIRGRGYKSGYKDEITMLTTIEHSQLMDRRYSINPDYLEWTFNKMHATLKNIKPE
ncbi:MAG: hypothetical protein MH137_09530 [Flavobacteriales bacterium]|nr:hypothetical protein [Flavobacteriales bacterium]